MEEKHLKVLFIASLAGFFVIIGLISWFRPVRFLEEYDFYIQLVTKTFETAAEILAVYVCWLLYSYLKESRFGKMTLLIYFAIVFINVHKVYCSYVSFFWRGRDLPPTLVSFGTALK